MGMPNVSISFKEKGISAVKRGERGIVALILKDSSIDIKNPIIVYNINDIPNTLSKENKEQIELALKGYVNTPQKVICYIIPPAEEGEEPDYQPALEYLFNCNFHYLVVPTVETDGKTESIASWVKNCRNSDKLIKAVLPNCKADNEGIINYTTKEVTAGEKIYTTEQYCARIAGLIAGTPLTISCTFAPLLELDDCSRMTREEMDKAVDRGELIVFWDGEKVKVVKGVNSLVTTNENKGDSFKKIKIVETMDMIHDDIKKTAEDNYLGKYPNSYDNKCILISSIKSYFEQLENGSILARDTSNVSIDIEGQRLYLKGKGIDTDELSDEIIKTYDTDDKVFLTGNIEILDAIEEIVFPITI